MQSSLAAAARSVVFVFVLVLIFTADSLPQGPAAGSRGQPIASILDADGTIRHSASGTFDTNGYRMAYGPNGEPRFVAAGGCTPDSWDTAFTTNGVDNDVRVIVADGLGNLYFGGDFTSVQGLPARGIAKWDGSTWSALGAGIGGAVNAIAISGTDIYVGGSFGSAGGSPARNAAKWNGTSWSALGAGLGGGTHVVEAVAVYNGLVYFGGSFNTADGSPSTGVARWDGSWSAAGTGAPMTSTFLVKDGLLYAGSVFSGGVMTWDGANWTSLGTLPGGVSDMVFNGTELWATGSFNFGGPTGLSHVVKWNGSTWEDVAFFGTNFSVYTLRFVGTNLYVGGSFTREGGQSISDGILRYDGTNWTGIGTGTQGGGHRVHALHLSGNTLFVGGDFTIAGGSGARNLATLTNETTWAGFNGTGLDGAPQAIAVSGSDVYVGGNFISAGAVTANRIAKWNSLTNTWSSLGGGISGFNTEFSSVSAIAVAGGKVYAGGSFPRIGGVAAANIAVWNGTAWAPLGTGITGGNARVYSILVQGNDVIVGGDFTTAGGVAVNRIAKWNGTSWSALPGNPPIPSVVIGMAFAGSDLYVGSVSTAVENPNYVLKFDGTTWTGISPGMGGHGISSLTAIGTDVYVSGGFSAVAGVPAARVAKWNGTSWSALGSGLPSNLGSSGVFLGASATDIVAIGDFTVASGGPANYIAKWNGSSWSPMGNGINAAGTRVRSGGGDIFIAGSFTTAGCNQSPYFARWRELVWTGAAGADWHTSGNWGGGSVPPANAGVTITAADASISSADVTVSSLIVSNNRTLTIGSGRTLTVTGTLDLTNGSIAGAGTLVVNGDISINNGNIAGLSSITVNGSLYLNGGMIAGPGAVVLTSCRTGALAGGSGSSFISSPLTRCVNASGAYHFPVGTGLAYSPVQLTNVVGSGNFTIAAKPGAYSDPAAGLPANRLQRWWQLANGGIMQADLTFNYLDSEVVGLEGAYRVYRINGGAAEVVPAAFNTTNNTATATGVTSFSAWTLAEAPASTVSVGGRVRRPDGRPVPFIKVTLTDGLGGSWTTVSKHSGEYRFDNLVSPRQYTLGVTPRKRAIFSVPQRVVTVSENMSNVDFVTSTP